LPLCICTSIPLIPHTKQQQQQQQQPTATTTTTTTITTTNQQQQQQQQQQQPTATTTTTTTITTTNQQQQQQQQQDYWLGKSLEVANFYAADLIYFDSRWADLIDDAHRVTFLAGCVPVPCCTVRRTERLQATGRLVEGVV
jgi:alpha-L-fucosidase